MTEPPRPPTPEDPATPAGREGLPGDANRLSRHLIGLSTAIRRRVSEGLLARGHDLNPSTTQVIPNLPSGGLGMSKLANRLHLTLQRTGQLVQQLEDTQYIKRVADDRDGRAKRVVYSKRGLDLLRDIDGLMLEITSEFGAILGSERFDRLCADLAALDEKINGADPALRIIDR